MIALLLIIIILILLFGGGRVLDATGNVVYHGTVLFFTVLGGVIIYLIGKDLFTGNFAGFGEKILGSIMLGGVLYLATRK